MDTRSYAVGFAVLGLLVTSFAALTLSPSAERTMVSEVLDDDAAPSNGAVSYEELSQPVQTAVDEVIREEFTAFSTYDDHAVTEELPRLLSVEKDGAVYHIRTTSADGSGGLFEGLARNVLLAAGGLLVGAAALTRVGLRRFRALAIVPLATTVAVLGTNALAAPDFTEVLWLSDAAFGIAMAAPLLVGIALRRRDYRVGGAAVGTLVLSAGVLLLGDRLSLLPILVGVVVLGIPAIGFGAWLGKLPEETV